MPHFRNQVFIRNSVRDREHYLTAIGVTAMSHAMKYKEQISGKSSVSLEALIDVELGVLLRFSEARPLSLLNDMQKL